MTFDQLVDALRGLEGLRDKGKRYPNFHYRSKPFLHFHGGDAPVAHVRFAAVDEEYPITDGIERAALFEKVRAHIFSR